MNNTKTDRFVMKKFQNVESKLTSGRPGTTTRGGIPRVPTAGQENDALNSARSKVQEPSSIAFGKNYRSGSASGQMRPPSATSKLTTQNLSKLNRRTSSNIGMKRPVDPEVVVFTGEEAKIAAADAAQEPGPKQGVQHRNYGKVPKYISKYKEEAADLARKREELRAKRQLPPGMTKMDEEERVATLEQLQSTKRELQTMLESLPISMRSENLRNQKRELEERLGNIERNITTFSRKIVFV
mmetsp:Transcript_35151/g.46297  ORF Transcript_35151/g.46297 Transcript_35151/m.46297 type:complete len:241 (+) Transcript_35151:204-926(+)|eukprot:CAMPEP_0185595314 /NCGR_PEP_ID=MMETSP0434-20130131/77973_1 /TAXON_ID=626734 ORGANISM="Favella taraikaensis, Strain Fe Narragansett Bay" /NCGR_SAMPLE_ID=MMETSP0434 /ASSEMBLY_ACC=CAM_ASM_000379 /LENGTH=240 /DNA_ID=CAMNT_0028223235 /DNA_START=139 /DNA_END=861 /DNA_ORIENTATION=-